MKNENITYILASITGLGGLAWEVVASQIGLILSIVGAICTIIVALYTIKEKSLNIQRLEDEHEEHEAHKKD